MSKRFCFSLCVFLTSGIACKSSSSTPPPSEATPETTPTTEATEDQPVANTEPSASTDQPQPATNADGVVPGSPDDPKYRDKRVSSSAGVEGGVVILWPRIVPATIADENRQLTSSLQQHVRSLVEKTLPGRPLDIRPEPERVCPRTGCKGVSINILFHRNNTGCVAIALINAPGTSDTQMIPWAGGIEFKQGQTSVPFREPPESHVTVKDYALCTGLLETMKAQDAVVANALKASAG